MESCRGVCGLMVASLHHFDKKQDPDPHKSEKLDPDSNLSEKSRSIRIRITTMRIRNPDYEYRYRSERRHCIFSLDSEDIFI
jgi:hypothetical protein